MYPCSRSMCIALAVLAPLVVTAQSSPLATGTMIVSGSAALERTTVQGNNVSTTAINIAPSVQWFISPHLALGGSVMLGYSSSGDAHSSTLGIGPSARFFFNESAPWLPFVSATVAPTWGSSRNGSSASVDHSGLSLDDSLGITRMMGSGVGFTGEAFYTDRKTSQDVGSTSTTQTVTDFGLRFGVTAFLH